MKTSFSGKKIIYATLALIVVVAVIAAFYPNSAPQPTNVAGGVMMGRDASVTSLEIAPSTGIASPAAIMKGGAPDYYPIVPAPQPGAGEADRQNVDTKIITNGSITMRVDHADQKLDQLKALVGAKGGFVASSQLSDNNGIKTAYTTLRIPSAKFNETVTAIKQLASVVLNESTQADDVTAQFIDLNARLKAAQAEEAQYMEILKSARTIDDTLRVTQQLGQVRATIEQLQGQLRYMADKTDYATLSVIMTEDTTIQAPTKTWKPLETLKAAIQQLVLTFQALIDGTLGALVFIIGLLLPIGLVLWFLIWVVRKIWRSIKK